MRRQSFEFCYAVLLVFLGACVSAWWGLHRGPGFLLDIFR
jgi:hypothetical protein